MEMVFNHYGDVTMNAMASQITGVSIVCSTVSLGAHQRKHQSSPSLAFVRGIHRWPVDSPHKGPVIMSHKIYRRMRCGSSCVIMDSGSDLYTNILQGGVIFAARAVISSRIGVNPVPGIGIVWRRRTFGIRIIKNTRPLNMNWSSFDHTIPLFMYLFIHAVFSALWSWYTSMVC